MACFLLVTVCFTILFLRKTQKRSRLEYCIEPTTGCLERTQSRVKCCTEAQNHKKDTRSHTLAHVLSHVPLSERDSVMIAAPGIRSIQESADCVSCTPILIRVRAWQCPRLLGNGRGQEILQGPISSAGPLGFPFPVPLRFRS